jgi:UDP-N-acetylglucosamine transferase subunit ALG13
MIFATVGTQLPFPRLVEHIDHLAGIHQWSVFVQTADPAARLHNVEHAAYLSPSRYQKLIAESELIVGHAGIGTLLTALESRTPSILVPRLYSMGEHRSDHQVATSKRLHTLSGVQFVDKMEDLENAIVSCQSAPRYDDKDNRLAEIQGFVKENIASSLKVVT